MDTFDKFIADLEKNLASTRPSQKVGTVTRPVTQMEVVAVNSASI